MKHIKLFESWMDGEDAMQTEMPAEQPSETLEVAPLAWAEFIYRQPTTGDFPYQNEIDSFGLTLANLPNGEPYADEYGYTLLGPIDKLEEFGRQVGDMISHQGIWNKELPSTK
jgi:hypothetical protein